MKVKSDRKGESHPFHIHVVTSALIGRQLGGALTSIHRIGTDKPSGQLIVI